MDHTSNNEVLNAIEKVSGKVDNVAEAVQTLATHVDKRIDDTKKDLTGQIGKLRSDLIDHVTRTVNNSKGDLVKEIRTERERAKLFDTKVLAVLERSKLVAPEEAVAMRELVM